MCWLFVGPARKVRNIVVVLANLYRDVVSTLDSQYVVGHLESRETRPIALVFPSLIECLGTKPCPWLMGYVLVDRKKGLS